MSAERRGVVDLPETVPIFPLPGVLLLPRAVLPLHIFEPRYRAMTRDALDGDRMIAMIQPSGPSGDPQAPTVYRTGCVGRISAVEEVDDGRFNLTLTGLSRFAVVTELPLLKGYRRAVADYRPFDGDLQEVAGEAIDRERVLAAFRAYLRARGLSADWDSIQSTRDEKLVNALSMLCPFTPSEKQALLEAVSLSERAQVLTALFEMAGFAANDDEPPPRH